MANTKTVYAFSPSTGEYVGTQPSYESPLEPGVFLEPANTTPTAPPAAAAGQAAVWASGAWSLVADSRGQKLYSTATGAAAGICTALGALPAGTTNLAPNTAQDQWNGAVWSSPPGAYYEWVNGAWQLNAALQASATLAAYKAQAQAALDASDLTMGRIVEGVALGLTKLDAADVVAWASYRRALRAALAATTAGTLPAQPAYPAGT